MKSTFLGKESTSPVKVVNQIRMRTLFNISTIQQLVFSKGAKKQHN